MPKSDWHIHTHNSCDCTKIGRSMEERIEELKTAGITDFGFSDHVHTFYNYPREIAASRREFDETLARHPELKGHMHFGIELSVMSEWEVDIIEHERVPADSLPYGYTYGLRTGGPSGTSPTMCLNDEIVQRYGIEYVVAGVHWGLYCYQDENSVWEDYRRQYLTAVANPHTDVLAHWLWWWNDAPKDMPNLFYDFAKVPQTLKDDLAAALKIYDTAFELNSGEINPNNPAHAPGYVREYLAYAKRLQESGVRLTFGSDTHGAYRTNVTERVDPLLREAGIDPDSLWVFPAKPEK
ncbi:MAG: hypothetical protein KIG36_00245 [Eubacteriales bacterium]|nr:hypothetical protein [Eubacteriales bacterium]